MNSDSPNTADIVRLLNALASDCDNTDGWQDAAPTVREAAAEITELREALECFSAKADAIDRRDKTWGRDRTSDSYTVAVRLDWCRNARAALKDHRKAQAHD